MTEKNMEMPGREMDQFLSPGWGAALSKNIISGSSGTDRVELIFKDKIKLSRTPEDMVRTVIAAVLAREFGPEITRTKFYAKMVSSIASALMANSEVKNRLLKMAVKYLDDDLSPEKNLKIKNNKKKKNKKFN